MTKKREIRKEAAGNRYSTANNAEKKMFTTLAALLVACGWPIQTERRELEGTTKQKYVFAQKENDLNIHTVEFLVGKGEEEEKEIKGLRIFQAGSERDSDFTKDMVKLDKNVKVAYGDRVFTWMGPDYESKLKSLAQLATIDVAEAPAEEAAGEE